MLDEPMTWHDDQLIGKLIAVTEMHEQISDRLRSLVDEARRSRDAAREHFHAHGPSLSWYTYQQLKDALVAAEMALGIWEFGK